MMNNGAAGDKGRRGDIILASASRSRRDMLAAAGLSFKVVPADVDEGAIRDAFLGSQDTLGSKDRAGAMTMSDAADVAQVLAIAKAEAVSRLLPGAIVIGADQVMAMEGLLFDKPIDMAGARDRLLAMRGRTHQLHAAVAIAVAGAHDWSAVDTAHMSVRDFSPGFTGKYLARAGDKVLSSVGAYQLEGLGVQLFDAIKGDFFTILGLPLLPLLEELRRRGILDS